MTRFTLSAVLGLGVLGGILTQTASAALPVVCRPGSTSSDYSAWYSPYGSTSASYRDDTYDRYGNRFNCGTTSRSTSYPNSRYGSWYDSDYRYTDYSRVNRLRDAYLDRFDDYRPNRLPAHRFYDSYYGY